MKNDDRDKEILSDFKSGKYQDPEKCLEFPLEAWLVTYEEITNKLLVLVGSDDSKLRDVLFDYVEIIQTEAFMRGLSIGYYAFGNNSVGKNAVELEQKIMAIKYLLLYMSIIDKLGPDVLTCFAEIGDDNE